MTILEHAGSTYEHSFILCFSFILEVGSDVCPLSLNYHFAPIMNYGPLCKYVILFMLMLDSYTLLLWENINNNTLNTFG
jgi:hypothetical protein